MSSAASPPKYSFRNLRKKWKRPKSDASTPADPIEDPTEASVTLASESKSQTTSWPPTIQWEELWGRAYDRLGEEHPSVVGEYTSNISQMPGYQPMSGANSLIDTKSVQGIVTELEKQREEKKWRIAFSARLFQVDIGVRDGVEKFLKFAMWSDGIVKDAISTQPYAALAWSGATMLLLVCTSLRELCRALTCKP